MSRCETLSRVDHLPGRELFHAFFGVMSCWNSGSWLCRGRPCAAVRGGPKQIAIRSRSDGDVISRSSFWLGTFHHPISSSHQSGDGSAPSRRRGFAPTTMESLGTFLGGLKARTQARRNPSWARVSPKRRLSLQRLWLGLQRLRLSFQRSWLSSQRPQP